MRCSFTDDPALAGPLFEFLDVVFPGLRRTAENARRWGAAWESVSTPFVHWQGGRLAAHVGIIELPLVVLGRPVRAGSVHAVATRPDLRRRGLCRLLMEEVLRFGEERHEMLLLTTEHPEYFTPFGFRHVREHRFTVTCRPSVRFSGSLRRLDLDDPDDLTRLHRLLDSRAPVSEVVGVGPEKAVFLFNEGHRPLYLSEDLDVVVCLEPDGPRLRLYDVVGPEIPPLEALVARWPAPLEDVALHFAPDRLAPGAVAEPYLLDHDGPSYLMVRGPFAAEAAAFTLPRSART